MGIYATRYLINNGYRSEEWRKPLKSFMEIFVASYHYYIFTLLFGMLFVMEIRRKDVFLGVEFGCA